MRRKAAALGVSAALAVIVGSSAIPAAAHTSLIGSTPEDGAVLTEAPEEIVLEFDEEVQPDFSQVAVLDAEENHYEDGDPQSAGPTVTQAVTDLPDGVYRISYRVGSSDGHTVTGIVEFTVDLPDDGAAGDEPATDAETAPGTDPTEAPASADGSEGDASEDGSATGEDGTPTATVVATMAAIAVVGVAGLLLIRRRQDAAGGDPPPGEQ